MVWKPNELEFLRENPEVFEEARNPRDLVDRISSFTKYYFDCGQATKMAFAWAEARGGYSINLKYRKDSNSNTLADIYLTDSQSTYRMAIFYTLGTTGTDLLERIKTYFDNSYGIPNPQTVFPNLWKTLVRTIKE